MSDERDPLTDQQLPVLTDEPHIHDLVSADLQARKEHGIKKYGAPLQASNGRNHLLDAYEEALDLCVYLKAQIESRTYTVPEDLYWRSVQAHSDLIAALIANPQATVQDVLKKLGGTK